MREPYRRRRKLAGWLAAAAFSLALPLAAQGEETRELAGIRAAFPAKRTGCFVRRYERGHLAANPAQSVATIRLGRLEAERKREDIDGPEGTFVGLRLAVTLRDGRAVAEPLDCESDDDGRKIGVEGRFLWCRSVCNRGRVDVAPLGPDRIRVTIGGQVGGRFMADAIGVGRSCRNDEGVVWLGEQAGDRVFVLERAPLGYCR